VFFSQDEVLENEQITIYTVLHNHSGEKNTGTVVFIDENTEIGSVPFSLENGVIQHAQIDYTPTLGTHNIKAEIRTEAENSIHKKTLSAETLTVLKDTDGDKIADINDEDDDNDGVSDIDEIAKGTDPLVKEPVAPSAIAQQTVEAVTNTLQDGGSSLIATIDPIAQKIAQKLEVKREKIKEEIKEIEKQNEEIAALQEKDIALDEHGEQLPEQKSTLGSQMAVAALSLASLSFKHWMTAIILHIVFFAGLEVWKRSRRKYRF
jgi:biotin operon repressor